MAGPFVPTASQDAQATHAIRNPRMPGMDRPILSARDPEHRHRKDPQPFSSTHTVRLSRSYLRESRGETDGRCSYPAFGRAGRFWSTRRSLGREGAIGGAAPRARRRPLAPVSRDSHRRPTAYEGNHRSLRTPGRPAAVLVQTLFDAGAESAACSGHPRGESSSLRTRKRGIAEFFERQVDTSCRPW